MTERTGWIVISRPDRLPTAIAAAQAVRRQFPGGVHLVREHSKWWDRAHWQRYISEFAGTHAFDRIESCRGLHDLPRLFRQTTDRLRALAQLPVDVDHDVIFALGGILTLSNAMVSAHPRAHKVLCVSVKVHRELIQAPQRSRYRFTTSGWLQNRIVEPMAGINRTLRFKPRFNRGGDGVRVERLGKDPEQIYDAIVVMSNSGDDIGADSSRKIITAPFPSIRDLDAIQPSPASADEWQRVVFFGTPFLLIHNLPPDVYTKHLNACLDYLRRNFPKHQLIYRPHPNETDEARQISLPGFRIEDDREAAELYFLRNYSSITAVFSVSSTVSRTALNNGLNGYAFYRTFPFAEQQVSFFTRVMGDVPPQFNITDLQSKPEPYQPLTNAAGRSFAAALNQATNIASATMPCPT